MSKQEISTTIDEAIEISEDINIRLSNYKEAHLTPGTTVSILELNHVRRLTEILLEKLDDLT
jgi:hypothetical protein